jgi:hypothetical protein
LPIDESDYPALKSGETSAIVGEMLTLDDVE